MRLAALLPCLLLAACGALLPRSSAVTESPWQTFEEAQQVFDRITPYKTTFEDLRSMNLDPRSNPNITILNYSDLLRRFTPSTSLDGGTIDAGVRDCLESASLCTGYEVDQRVMKRDRYGSFVLDFLNFKRKVNVVGWRFNGVILLRDGVVVYKLTGGQPAIHEHEEALNPLGPLQGIGDSLLFGR